MDRGLKPVVGMLALSVCIGCGSSETTPLIARGGQTDQTNTTPSTPTESSAEGPMVETARGFLEAVIAGDTQRATSLLTPQAVQQIEKSGKAFAPPGLETANFRVGEVLNVSKTQAFVQCYLTSSTDDLQTQEEMCCVVKQIGSRWLISGIAFQLAPNRPPFILDFEKPAAVGPIQQMASQSGTGNESETSISLETSISSEPQTPRTADRYGTPAAR